MTVTTRSAAETEALGARMAAALQGGEVLAQIIETDEGSHFLGEVALVSYSSPIRETGMLFYSTLFDENASCHLALGSAYPTCVQGGPALSSEEKQKRGWRAKK